MYNTTYNTNTSNDLDKWGVNRLPENVSGLGLQGNPINNNVFLIRDLFGILKQLIESIKIYAFDLEQKNTESQYFCLNSLTELI